MVTSVNVSRIVEILFCASSAQRKRTCCDLLYAVGRHSEVISVVNIFLVIVKPAVE